MADPPPGVPPATPGPAEPTSELPAAAPGGAAAGGEPGTEVLRSRVRGTAPAPAHTRRHGRPRDSEPTLDLPVGEVPDPPVDPWADAAPLPPWAPPTLV
ncbi:MAG TPA: hypothetical protein VNV66_09465, partial [Pilimelia sp.]|nr:hypothetical protein [Pilimelia sp.]